MTRTSYATSTHKGRIRKFAFALSTLSIIAVASACTTSQSEPDSDDAKPPSGTVNLCKNWTKGEFKEYDDEAKKVFPAGGHQTARLAYNSNRCAVWEESNVYGLTDMAIVPYSHFSDKDNHRDPSKNLLADVYETYLTSDGLLSAWSTTVRGKESGPSSDSVPIEKQKSSQETIGLGLAEASDADREQHTSPDFAAELTSIGASKVELRTYDYSISQSEKWKLLSKGPVVHGWSVLAPLLRFGEFHEDFLTPIATDIVEFDQKHDGDWTVKGEKAMSFDMYDKNANNSMDAVLEALSRNDTAAKQVAKATGDERVESLVNK